MRYFEDLNVGDTFRTGSIEITEDDIRDFARQFDPQPFHLDEEHARETIFGRLVASGWHTAAITMRLLVEGNLQLAGGLLGLGADTLQWPRAVLPGDRLRVVSEILEMRPSQSRPDRGIVKVRHTTLNQRDEAVQIVVTNQLVLRRPSFS
jgi:acyl dehydratase